MASTLPSMTQLIDTTFTTTWYDIKPDAADNIMLATNVWAALNERGRMKEQRGGDLITRTIEYAIQAATAIQKGQVFEPGITENRTMARWGFRYIGTNVQRSLMDDRSNSGKYKIIDYVTNRLTSARKGLKTKFETAVLTAEDTTETGIEWQTLNDIVPAYANATTGTYGQINRPTTYGYLDATNTVLVPATGNTWWGPKYMLGVGPIEVNYEADLTNMWNAIHNNQVPPDLLLTTKYLIEVYEQFATDKTQIVKNEGSATANLGFTTFKFKGSDMTWTPNMTAKHTLFLTTDSIDVVYDPGMWFDMTEWKAVPNSLDRFAQILCAGNVVTDEPRRHGRLYYA